MPGQSFHGIREGLARPTLFPALPQDTVPTLRAEWEANHAWSFQTWLHRGGRPFRDHMDLWSQAHPGQVPGINRFLGLQQLVAYRGASGFRASAGASWQHQDAVAYQSGVSGNGFRWFLETGWRWR